MKVMMMSFVNSMYTPTKTKLVYRQEIVCFARRQPLQKARKQVRKWLRRREGTQEEANPSDYRRRVRLEVRTRGSKRLQDDTNSGRSLKEYLSLPVTEYNLIDPEWIQRVPKKGLTAFRVTVPLDKLLKVNLRPVLDVRVRPNPQNSSVNFLLEGVTFGRVDLDKALSIRVASTLSSHDSRRGPWQRFRRRQSPQITSMLEDIEDLKQMGSAGVVIEGLEQETQTETSTVEQEVSLQGDCEVETDKSLVEEIESTSSPAQEEEMKETEVDLDCSVRLRMNVAIPPVLNLVPNVILISTGRIVLRSILNGALPNFLELVATDYLAWASGSERSISKGKLFMPTEDSV